MIFQLPHLIPHKRVRREFVDGELQDVNRRGIAFVRGTRNCLWYYEDSQESESWQDDSRLNWEELKPEFGQSHILKHFPDEKLSDSFKPTSHLEFFDFHPDNETPGRLKKHVGPGGQVIEVF